MYFCAQCSITYEKSNKKGLCQAPDCKATLKWKCPDCSNTVRWNWRSRHKCDPNGANYARNNQSKTVKNNMKTTSNKTQSQTSAVKNALRQEIGAVHTGSNALPSLVSILPGQNIVDSPERGFQPHWAMAGVPANILRASVHNSGNVVPEGGLPAMRYFQVKSEDIGHHQRTDANGQPMHYHSHQPMTSSGLQGLHIPKMTPASMMMMSPMHGIEYLTTFMPPMQQQPMQQGPGSPARDSAAVQPKATTSSPEGSRKRKAENQTSNPSKKPDAGTASKSSSAKKASALLTKKSSFDMAENEATSSGVSALIDAAAAADLEYNKSNQANKTKSEPVKKEESSPREQKSPSKKPVKAIDEKASGVNSNNNHVSILPIKKRGALACV